jgi:hypothetical protein
VIIDLSCNQLSGTFDITNLSPLMKLNVSHNSLTGFGAYYYMKTQTSIIATSLDLSFNALTGDLDVRPEIYNTIYLDLSHNFLTGNFTNINNTSIQHLDLSDNEFISNTLDFVCFEFFFSL